jgi:hypothetical protein
MSEQIKNGYYRFTSERASYKSIAQNIDGNWFLIGEVEPVTMHELNQRGWVLDSKVGKMKIK